MVNYSTPDLTQHAPRSVRARLGGYVHLPRMLDKARASAAGKLGEYHYNCPLDKRFFAFTGIDHEALLAAVKSGKTDTEMLAWVEENTTRQPAEIATWSVWLENRSPGSIDMHGWFAEFLTANVPAREDISAFFDLIELDDYVTFGGKA